ncbi:class I SAM-dependent methyltransferase [Amylibacter sp.]|nr:class I SAM-dependent methyltransferase [Amylibacter sp.]
MLKIFLKKFLIIINKILNPMRVNILRVHPYSMVKSVYDYPYDLKKRKLNHNINLMFAKSDFNFLKVITELKEMEDFFKKIEIVSSDAKKPSWENGGYLSILDAASICLMVNKMKPSVFYEIGSGNSTKFAKSSIEEFSPNTKITSIDPFPRSEVNEICDEIIRKPLEIIDISIFKKLKKNDILFFDGSHRSYQGSDVTVFFTEILPILSPGVIVCVHDIFLPHDYPKVWAERLYNEQYLLAAYLLANKDLNILMANNYIGHNAKLQAHLYNCFSFENLGSIFDSIYDKKDDSKIVSRGGGAFWFKT